MIKQTHKDHEIYFSESSEEWVCDDFGLSNKSLKSIKAAIDRADKKSRTMVVPALYLRCSYWDDKAEVLECTIVLIRSSGRATANIKIKGEDDTEQVSIDDLYPLDQRKKLDRYVTIKQRELAARKEADALMEDMTCHTKESLREAVVQQADEAA